jgi:hypothetical protein
MRHLLEGERHCVRASDLCIRSHDACGLGERMDDSGLRALSEQCHALEVLNLKDARLATDVGVKHLSQGCPSLTSLNLSGRRRLPLRDERQSPAHAFHDQARVECAMSSVPMSCLT